MNSLVESLREFLRTEVSGKEENLVEFSINGNMIEAWLYDEGIRHVLNRLTQDKAAMLRKTAAIFENATYLYSTGNDPHSASSKNINITGWDYFYTPIVIDGEKTGVRIAVKNMERSEYSHIYDWGIKRKAPLDGTLPPVQQVGSGGVSSGAVSNRSVSHPPQAVKAKGVDAAAETAKQGSQSTAKPVQEELDPYSWEALFAPAGQLQEAFEKRAALPKDGADVHVTKKEPVTDRRSAARCCTPRWGDRLH